MSNTNKLFSLELAIYETKKDAVPVKLTVMKNEKPILQSDTIPPELDVKNEEDIWLINDYGTTDIMTVDEIRGVFKIFGLKLDESKLK